MHTLINEDRQAHGLQPVEWDETAAIAALQHAQEMADFGYISHWNLDGYGPDYRYTSTGGAHVVFENVYTYEHSPGGGPTTAEEWEALIQEAQQTLMDSPGHRDNILAPEHTHVAIGIDYSESTGRLAIAQEFVNQYMTLTPLPRSASVGQTVQLSGWLGPRVANPLLNLAYEPFPAPRNLADLRPEPYRSPAEVFDVPNLTVSDDGRLSAAFVLDNNAQPGLYHVWLWVETEHGFVQAVGWVIRVS
ncbi:MAG: CAP domain-containing protein [Anaerolineae bacterium]|nr:CAP domain-containing protein [Anaerolineae bacterium]